MKNLYLKASAVALMAGIYSSGASAAAIPGDASANVITPLVLTEVTPMNFGTIAPSTTVATTVTLTPGAGRTGTATLLTGPTTASLGKFTIQGDLNQTFSIALSVTGAAPNVRLENAAGDFMTVTALTENSTAIAGAGGTLTGGVDNFDIGGTLNVAANQPAGAYSTATGTGVTFTVTANYE